MTYFKQLLLVLLLSIKPVLSAAEHNSDSDAQIVSFAQILGSWGVLIGVVLPMIADCMVYLENGEIFMVYRENGEILERVALFMIAPGLGLTGYAVGYSIDELLNRFDRIYKKYR